MGTFAIFSMDEPRYNQLLASTVKVPALFFLTLLITFPSLYVFNTLVGSRLRLPSVLRLLVASLGVNLAVLSSLGPIVAFFSVNTTSHPFMILLNVLVFAMSGLLGMMFLLQTLHRLSVALRQRDDTSSRMFTSPEAQSRQPPSDQSAPQGADSPTEASDTAAGEVEAAGQVDAAGAADAADHVDTPAPSAASFHEGSGEELIWAELAEEPGPLDRLEGHFLGRHVKVVFACWMVIFGLVGAQMSWVLRPFIGSPDKPFQWFCPRESNFFEAVWQSVQDLLL
ncbi:hypothetical protein LCGC14_2411700 [marine sediment metagenome]|uniref:Uncharacterized protein n=1 Tax=marine sediment metagenome TaxID=412755 RepID=A0A0F9BSC4_9ZZZZ